ncbi:MAG: hypothetical protein ABL985_17080 [Casimicrobium sp.]
MTGATNTGELRSRVSCFAMTFNFPQGDINHLSPVKGTWRLLSLAQATPSVVAGMDAGRFERVLAATTRGTGLSVAEGTVTIYRSAFVKIAVEYFVHSQRQGSADSVAEKYAGQLYYSLKQVFHRHKFHDEKADGLIKVYADASPNENPTSHQFERVRMRLARAITTYLGLSSINKETVEKIHGFNAYLAGLAAACRFQFGGTAPECATGFDAASLDALAKAGAAMQFRVETETTNRITVVTVALAVLAIVAGALQIFAYGGSSQINNHLNDATHAIVTEVANATGFLSPTTSLLLLWTVGVVLLVTGATAISKRFVVNTNATPSFIVTKRLLDRVYKLFTNYFLRQRL